MKKKKEVEELLKLIQEECIKQSPHCLKCWFHEYCEKDPQAWRFNGSNNQ